MPLVMGCSHLQSSEMDLETHQQPGHHGQLKPLRKFPGLWACSDQTLGWYLPNICIWPSGIPWLFCCTPPNTWGRAAGENPLWDFPVGALGSRSWTEFTPESMLEVAWCWGRQGSIYPSRL